MGFPFGCAGAVGSVEANRLAFRVYQEFGTNLAPKLGFRRVVLRIWSG